MEIESIVLSVDSRPVVAADKALDDFAKAGAGAEASAKGVSRAWSETSASLKKVSADTGAAVAALDRLNATQSAALAEITRFAQAASRMQVIEQQLASVTDQLSKAQAELARQTQATAQAQSAAASAATPFTQKMNQAATAVGAAGVSARQTAAAMRQLPAQLSDVVVSLAGGQNPLMVLLQQGSQVKDSFGGIGNTFKALGAAISPTVVIVGALAAALGTIAYGAIGGAKESTALKTALIETGGAAGLTAGQISGLAEATGKATGQYTKSREAAQLLAASGKFAGAELSVALRGVVDGAANGTKSVETLVEEFASLGREPTKAVIKLNESTNFLTTSVFNQISALERQGRAAEASALAQKAYADALSNRRGEIVQNIGYVEGAWNAVGRAIDRAKNAILDMGRDRTAEEQLAITRTTVQNAKDLLKTAQDRLATNPNDRYTKQELASRENNYNQHLQRLFEMELEAQGKTISAQNSADRKRDEQRSFSAKQELDSYDKTLTKANQLNAQLKENARIESEIRKVDPNDPRVSEAAVAERRATTIKNLTEKTSTAAATAAAAQERYSAQAMTAIEAQIAEQLVLNEAQRQQGVNAEAIVPAQKEIIKLEQQLALEVKNRTGKQTDSEIKAQLAKLGTLKVMQEQYAQTGRDIKLEEAFREERNKGIIARATEVDKIRERAQLTEDEAAAVGKSKAEIEALTIARLEEQRAILSGFEGSTEVVRSIEEEIAARRRLANAISNKETREANEKAAKDAAKDWDKVSEQIGQSLSDALMNGGVSGADFVKRLFSTMVLRPLLEPALKAGVGAVTGALGLNNPQSAVGAAGGAFNTMSTLQSLYSSVSGGLISTVGSALSGVGSAIGSQALSTFALGVKSALPAGIAGPTLAGAPGAAGLGASFGTALPYIGAAVAGVTLLTKLFSKKSSPGVGTYGLADIAAGGSVAASDESLFFGDRRGFKGQSADTTMALADLGDQIAKSAAIYGGTAEGLRLYAQTAYSPDGKGASGGTAIYDRNGTQVFGSSFSGTNAAMAENLQLSLQRALLGGLQQSNLAPQFARVLNDAVDIGTATAEELQQISAALEEVRTLHAAFDQFALTFPQLATAGSEAREAIASAAGGLENFSTQLGSYYQGYYSEQERMDKSLASMSRTFNELGVSTLPETRQELRTLIEAQDLTTSSGQQVYAALLGMSTEFGAWADYSKAATEKVINDTKAALDKEKELAEQRKKDAQDALNLALGEAKTFADNSLSILTAAINKRKGELQRAFDLLSTGLTKGIDAAETAVGNISALSGRLKSTLDSMLATIDPVANRAAAQSQISRALVTAQTTGVMPLASDLENALSVVAQPSTDLFKTFEDYQVDFLATANDIARLQKLTDGQLTVEQQTLATLKAQLEFAQQRYNDDVAALDRQLEYAQEQINIALGTQLAVMSVENAIVQMNASIILLASKNAAAGGPVAGGGTSPGGLTAAEQAVYDAYKGSGLQNLDAGGFQFWTDAINNGADPAAIAAQIIAINNAKANGSHAKGLWDVPFDGYNAILHKGETVLPAPEAGAYRALQDGRGAGSQDMSAMFAQMDARLARIERYSETTSVQSERLADDFDRVTNKGNAMVTEPLEAIS